MKFFILVLFAFSTAKAASIECQTLINLESVAKGSVDTAKNRKILVSEHPEVNAFVSETGAEIFLVEAFLPQLQMRIYAEGSLRNKSEKLTASAWSRELMVDVVCSLR